MIFSLVRECWFMNADGWKSEWLKQLPLPDVCTGPLWRLPPHDQGELQMLGRNALNHCSFHCALLSLMALIPGSFTAQHCKFGVFKSCFTVFFSSHWHWVAVCRQEAASNWEYQQHQLSNFSLVWLWVSALSSPWNGLERLMGNHCFSTGKQDRRVDMRLYVFHCCAGSMLGFPLLSSGGAHPSQGHVEEVAGAALRSPWHLCRAFPVAPELCSSTSKFDKQITHYQM